MTGGRLAASVLLALASAAWAEGGPAAAQQPERYGTVQGVVVDSATGEPVAGAMVRLGAERQEVTHADGAFHLTRIRPGEYTLSVERLGYRTLFRPVTVRAGERVTLRLVAPQSAIRLEGFVVTGGVGGRAQAESFRSVGVVAGDELARRMGATVASALEEEVGVAAVSMGPATARPVIRGLSGDRVLVLEDGERVGDMSATSPDHAVAIEPLSAQRVEVLRGPAALLYGSSAIGGVVNVIRREVPHDVPDRPAGTASLLGQSASGAIAGEATALWGVGRLALRGEVTGRRSGDIRTPAGELGNTDAESRGAAVGFGWVNGWGHAGVAARYYAGEYGLPGGFEGGHEEGVRVDLWRQVLRGEVEAHEGVGPFSSVELDAAYTRYYHEEVEASGLVGTRFGLTTSMAELLARHEGLGPFDNGAVGARFEYRNTGFGGALRTPGTVERAAAVYAVEELGFGRLDVQVGARYDRVRVTPDETGPVPGVGEVRPRTFGAVSGSVAAIFEAAEGVRAGANVSRAFRTPDGQELYSSGPHIAAYSEDVGNPDLGAETGLGVEAFLRVSRAGLAGEAAAYRYRIDDYIYLRNTGRTGSRFGLPVYRQTNGDAVLTGAEASAEWTAPGGVVLEVAGSAVRGTLVTTGEPLPLVPPPMLRLGIRSERRSHWLAAGVRAAARQDRVGAFEEPTDGYAVVDMSASYRFTLAGRAHSVVLRIDNALDAEYRNHLSRLKAIMPEPGRGASVVYRVLF